MTNEEEIQQLKSDIERLTCLLDAFIDRYVSSEHNLNQEPKHIIRAQIQHDADKLRRERAQGQ